MCPRQRRCPAPAPPWHPPAQVAITFDGPLEPAFSSLKVDNAAGTQVNMAKSHVDPKQPDVISVALPPLVAGRYTVH